VLRAAPVAVAVGAAAVVSKAWSQFHGAVAEAAAAQAAVLAAVHVAVPRWDWLLLLLLLLLQC
jgi:hypothetical protein